MGITVSGVDNLVLALTQAGERAVRGVSKQIERGAEKIKDKAVEYAPVDEGNLEEAIRVDKDRSGVNGRLQAFVYVDGDVDAGDGKTVGDYALSVHEGVSPHGSGGHGKIGKKSRIKDGGSGRVGGKFLERAAQELTDEIFSDVQREVKKALS